MTDQEFFDQTVLQLADQGAFSYDPENKVCCYRGPNDTKCAAGFWMTDEEAARHEGKSIEWGWGLDIFCQDHILVLKSDLAVLLQRCHDDAAVGCVDLYEALEDVANNWPLSTSVLKSHAKRLEGWQTWV